MLTVLSKNNDGDNFRKFKVMRSFEMGILNGIIILYNALDGQINL